ncbi:tRNA dimethylallyltransferase 2 isoform X2 [Rhododendron vialii]|uniref:tRNA dimethylallyltransferase 2 isoform X2 n=1 Tax=Rhododendron vialii TaxID=182163 RepID=UPI00265EA193|nr:tRNA dimethylallyltransferase 2 isoform X2 [Rhododendron vialii]
MENGTVTQVVTNPSSGRREKPKVVVVLGATGSGKSKLAIDLASHFPVEIINGDSMQVYRGLDVLTNKVPLQDQKGVPHHLLGTISPDVEFTAKDFRDSAIPLIDDILSRNHIPVIVGGTNYYIQALVSPFLLDESVEEMDENFLNGLHGDEPPESELEHGCKNFNYSYDCLKDLDPDAASRIHPNDHRKINQYLSLYARSGVLPSKLLQGKAMENWGRADNFRYNCCFICVDASLAVLDEYVEWRVDCMVDAGLLGEVYDIYCLDADYTRGLRQAIGVREFEDFLRVCLSDCQSGKVNALPGASHLQTPTNKHDKILKDKLATILNSTNEMQLKLLVKEAIDKVKVNTRRLVRRQVKVHYLKLQFFLEKGGSINFKNMKRRLKQLQMLFGWNIHYVDATESFLCANDDSWAANVVQPSVRIVSSLLKEDESSLPDPEVRTGTGGLKLSQRDLWTQYVCKACGDRVLRGAHEWEQHEQGRGHRKRISRLRKSGNISFVE